MEIHTYSKDVVPEVILDMFKLDARIWSKIAYINSDDYSEGHDNIIVAFKEAPMSADLDVTAEIINGYTSDHLLVLRNRLEIELCNPAIQFGRNMLAKIGANNMARGKSAAEIDEMMGENKLIHCFVTGSIITAYSVLSGYEVTINGGGTVAGFSLDEVLEFKRRCGLYIGAVT